MRFLSLFAGIGGIDLGLERAGMQCIGQVEINAYCQRVLAKHWSDVPRYGDVRTFHGDEFGPFDLLTGGYPCQPFSTAGKRQGEDDPRHLWPEVIRIIRNVRPRLVLLENVPGHLSLGFGRVLGDLAESGYDCEWDCIPAASLGAPHIRDRVFIVAQVAHSPVDFRRLPSSERCDMDISHDGIQNGWDESTSGTRGGREEGDVADANDGGSGNRPTQQEGGSIFGGRGQVTRSSRWEIEPDVGRVANGIPSRVDRLRGLGNAVVPQVAEFIGRQIMEVYV